MIKLDERGLERALEKFNTTNTGTYGREAMRAAIEEYLTPPPKPKWPSDESYNAYFKATGWNPAACGIEAALRADPIIKAAIRVRNCNGYVISDVQAVVDAVNEAGL